MKHGDRITFDPDQCGGRPCIRHYRIRVKDVLDILAAGVSEAEILKDYDFLCGMDSARSSRAFDRLAPDWKCVNPRVLITWLDPLLPLVIQKLQQGERLIEVR